jgi:hypothetical protein
VSCPIWCRFCSLRSGTILTSWTLMNVQADRRLSNNSPKSSLLGTRRFIGLHDLPIRIGEIGLKAGFCSRLGNCCQQTISRFARRRSPAYFTAHRYANHLSHWLMMGTMKHHEIPPTVRPYGRLKLVGAGLAFAVVGTTLLLSGVQVVTHWTGQPMFSWGLIAAGGLCIVLALIPASWIAKAATIDSRTPRHR